MDHTTGIYQEQHLKAQTIKLKLQAHLTQIYMIIAMERLQYHLQLLSLALVI